MVGPVVGRVAVVVERVGRAGGGVAGRGGRKGRSSIRVPRSLKGSGQLNSVRWSFEV